LKVEKSEEWVGFFRSKRVISTNWSGKRQNEHLKSLKAHYIQLKNKMNMYKIIILLLMQRQKHWKDINMFLVLTFFTTLKN